MTYYHFVFFQPKQAAGGKTFLLIIHISTCAALKLNKHYANRKNVLTLTCSAVSHTTKHSYNFNSTLNRIQCWLTKHLFRIEMWSNTRENVSFICNRGERGAQIHIKWLQHSACGTQCVLFRFFIWLCSEVQFLSCLVFYNWEIKHRVINLFLLTFFCFK